ncbi:hypothetical protein [Bradyrhizobium sp.]|uniref:COG4223 family protein n=1 Tax=Bradyrhizobium sp. TaxID=376 RepID=UPI001D458821|nr:hypothetical protein [Bradyrhizobium sp.]MBI5322622.1 hypothetical protein [Bradyrhizobium sp.]
MVDDRPEEGAPAEPSRPKREPPTIDLKATDVTETPKAEAGTTGESGHTAAEAAPQPSQPVSQPISPWAIAPVSGAVAAALVIGVGWVLGWPAVQAPAPAPAPQLNAAAIDDLTVRIAGLESKAGKPAAPVADPAAAARMDGIEKSVAALRSELAATRAQADKLASAVNEVKAQPRADGSAPAPVPVDLSPVNDRIAQIERAAKAQESEIAALKSAETKPVDTKPADDAALRRVVAASLLDVSVRHGDPFAAQLATAKSLAASADALKPLEAFAASGVPGAPALCRELVAIVPKLAPPPPEAETTGSGIVDRLQAGATKLVRIQRADATGTDRASVVARVTAAALRNDLNEARRELNTLAPADRAAAQAWLEKADTRDAALAASRKFASDAMAALATAK